MNDLDLYNVCMNFCKMYTNVMSHQNQLKIARLSHNGMEASILADKIEMEKEFLKERYEDLVECVDKFRSIKE